MYKCQNSVRASGGRGHGQKPTPLDGPLTLNSGRAALRYKKSRLFHARRICLKFILRQKPDKRKRKTHFPGRAGAERLLKAVCRLPTRPENCCGRDMAICTGRNKNIPARINDACSLGISEETPQHSEKSGGSPASCGVSEKIKNSHGPRRPLHAAPDRDRFLEHLHLRCPFTASKDRPLVFRCKELQTNPYRAIHSSQM